MTDSTFPEELIQNPERYLAEGFYKNPELYKLTKFILSSVIEKHPSLFFYYNLDKYPEFEAEKNNAALRLVEKDPLSALFIYKFHRKPEFDFLWILLLRGLLKGIKDTNEAKKDESLIFEISRLVGEIHKKYPDFAQAELKNLPRTESGESEYTK